MHHFCGLLVGQGVIAGDVIAQEIHRSIDQLAALPVVFAVDIPERVLLLVLQPHRLLKDVPPSRGQLDLGARQARPGGIGVVLRDGLRNQARHGKQCDPDTLSHRFSSFYST